MYSIYGIKKKDNPLLFTQLLSFVGSIHSSACVEHIISQINLNKSKLRNGLSNESPTGILQTKRMINKEGKLCFYCDISKCLIRKHKFQVYKLIQISNGNEEKQN